MHRIGFFVEVGDEIGTATDHTQRAGFVITVGETREEAIGRAQRVTGGVRVLTTGE